MEYNKLTIFQNDTLYLQVTEETATEKSHNGGTGKAWNKPSRKFHPTTGAYKIILWCKFTKYKPKDVIRDPEYCITNMKLLRMGGDFEDQYQWYVNDG